MKQHSATKKGKKSYIIGKKFESFVYNIFYGLSKPALKKNVILKKKDFRSEFDIIYGIIRKTYVECKYKSIDYFVTNKEVSVFAKKLDLHKINNSHGIIITNTYLTKKAKIICKQSNIQFIERQELKRLNYERLGLIKSLAYILNKNNKTLESRINSIKL